MFEFGLYIPQDFDFDISHFELWVDDYVVGEKKEWDKSLRHLTLALTGEEKVFVRLYNGEEVVDDCTIDPTAYQGELKIKDYEVKKAEDAKKRVIGSFDILNIEKMGLIEIGLKIHGVEEIFYYRIENEAGTALVSKDKKVPVTEGFTYLQFLQPELENLKIQCYGQDENLVCTAYFDSLKYEIFTLEE